MDTSEGKQLVPGDTEQPYVIKLSRLTIDKLGVKLYDKVSAVVAELIANGYDADAESVTVRLPLSTVLATKAEDGSKVDSGYMIEVVDDGHGMTPEEAVSFYLIVGGDRRLRDNDGARSREKERPVMGRKGIGKLAPFGICKQIEVISAGGERTEGGYLITNFVMDFDRILQDTDESIQLEAGPLDRRYSPSRGTTIRLTNFLPKRVPDLITFERQIATRFIFADPKFTIALEDTRNPDENPAKIVDPFSLPIAEDTRIDLAERPVVTEDGEKLLVTGWLAMAQSAYKNEEGAGVRIYARNKIVGTTRDFEQPAGFTGEFTMRSYLVGEVNAEWLDKDDGDDLVRTDRQGILWDSDYGLALRKWGGELMKEIGRTSARPRRERKSNMFLEVADFENRAHDRFGDQVVADIAIDLAKQIGGFAAEDELGDEQYVDDLSEIILAVAPHKALIQSFQEFGRSTTGNEAPMERLLDLFGRTRIAEMASYSQIAEERVRSIHELEGLVFGEAIEEAEFQKLIARAPWLIEPTWTVITRNQSLRTFKAAFENFWRIHNGGEELVLAIDFETKRPDFTLVSVGYQLHIVEIKKSNYTFSDEDFDRLINYVYAFREFWGRYPEITAAFSKGWSIDLVADGVDLRKLANRSAYDDFVRRNEIRQMPWGDFLQRAKTAHELFLNVGDEADAARARFGEN